MQWKIIRKTHAGGLTSAIRALKAPVECGAEPSCNGVVEENKPIKVVAEDYRAYLLAENARAAGTAYADRAKYRML